MPPFAISYVRAWVRNDRRDTRVGPPVTGAVRTAVILAAGMGIRLGGLGREIPKGFLRLGEQPIVEESLRRLLSAGVERVLIVTGHLAEFYQSLQARYPDVVELVHNPHYAVSGSMYSLYCAREFLADDFLLLESDIVYEQRALLVLQGGAEPDVVLCSAVTGSDDAVFVTTEGRDLREMSKQRAVLQHTLFGELVGITRVSATLFGHMREQAERLFESGQRIAYETDCLVAAARAYPVRCLRVDDLVWCEIDHQQHLERAREVIYPRLDAPGFSRASG